MDARGRRAGSRGPTEGTPGRRAASTSAPQVAPPPPAGLGRRSAAGRRAGTAERRRAGDPPGIRWACDPARGQDGPGDPAGEQGGTLGGPQPDTSGYCCHFRAPAPPSTFCRCEHDSSGDLGEVGSQDLSFNDSSL
ncbi:hypothetical protein MC885_019338, partial [Smutsia gigantea]